MLDAVTKYEITAVPSIVSHSIVPITNGIVRITVAYRVFSYDRKSDPYTGFLDIIIPVPERLPDHRPLSPEHQIVVLMALMAENALVESRRL